MKQVSYVCLALLLALSLTACGQKADANPKGNLNGVEQQQTEPDSKAFQPDYSPEQKNFLGNTAANLMQGAYVAKQGDWIYYFNGVKGIQKRNDVTGETKDVTSESGSQISVQGDYIYFINDISNDDLGELCRIRTDGEDFSIIANDLECVKSDYIHNAFYSIAGDTVYFCQYIRQPNGDTKKFLCKMNLEGSEIQPLFEADFLYGTTETHVIFELDDSEKVNAILLEGGTDEIIEFKYKYTKSIFDGGGDDYRSLDMNISFEGDALYYYYGKKFYQAKIESPDQFNEIADIEDLIEKSTQKLDGPETSTMNAYNGNLFFWKGGLVKVDVKTGEVKQLNESAAHSINVVDDKWVYYRDKEGLNRVSWQGTGWELLANKI